MLLIESAGIGADDAAFVLEDRVEIDIGRRVGRGVGEQDDGPAMAGQGDARLQGL